MILRSVVRGQPVDQRALSRPGRSGNAHDKRFSRFRENSLQKFFRARVVILNRSDGTRNRAHVPCANLLSPVFYRS
jgi:hypothetical protein